MRASVTVDVPVRVCDVGGWTDTWFAGHGRVCSLAVDPGISVRADTAPGSGEVRVTVVDYGASFAVGSEPAKHRLLAEAVREAGAPGDFDVHLHITSAVPPATSLGTSASVCVGVIAAVDALRGPIRPARSLAAAAHAAEAVRLGRQSGVQDQIAASYGGANVIEITDYPRSEVRGVVVPAELSSALDARLAHVSYGGPHDSSSVHAEVIDVLDEEGPSSPRLERLRELAGRAGHALTAGDLDLYGGLLTAATDAQATLHPALISGGAGELIDLARSCDASGWKVNGAGGEGGSISILCRNRSDRDHLLTRAQQLGHAPLHLSLAGPGARVVTSTPPS